MDYRNWIRHKHIACFTFIYYFRMMPEEIVEAEITPDSKPEPNNVIRPPVLTCAGYCHGFLRLCYVMLALLLLLTRLLVPPDVALSPYTISHYIAAVCAYWYVQYMLSLEL